MKRKLFYLFSLMLLCIIGTSGASADTYVFTPDKMTGQPAETMGSTTANNVWFGNGTDLDAGFIIQITGNKGKAYTNQGTIAADEGTFASFKNSNGAENTITLPSGILAESVDFYATTNANDGNGVLSNFNGTSCSDVVTSVKDGANPTKISKTLSTPANSFTFTFGTKQVLFLAIVHPYNPDAKPEITSDLSSTANVSVGVSRTFAITATGADSYQWYTCDNADGDNPVAIDGATSASYSYTAEAEGTEYIYCAAINDNGPTLSTICAVTATESSDKYNNTEATFSWAVGNESAATIAGDDVDADDIKTTKVKAGYDLTVGTASNYVANPGNTMVTYKPGTSNAGSVTADMVEYTIKVAKGVTFTPTSVTYDAVKEGTDNASYSWSYTVDGTESTITTVSASDLLRNSKTAPPALNHVEDLTGAAEGRVVTVRFYVSGFGDTKKFALSNVQINGVLNGSPEQRAFTDFKIDFRSDPYTTILPTSGELPEGVEVSYSSYNGAQHGVVNPTITVPVDGPVKFTIGACQYGSGAITITDADNNVINFSNKGACGEQTPNYNQNVTWTYNSETPTTLTFALNGYLPYFFAEACEYIETCDVTYYDTDGTTILGIETVEGGSDLVYAYGADDVTVASGDAFRGWFNANAPTATKVAEGTAITEDTKLYAKATEIEVAEVGKIFTYDLNKQNFYQEDHECFSATNGSFHDGTHGWAFGSGSSFSVQVAGTAQVLLTLCQYGTDGTIAVTDANNTDLGTIEHSQSSTDGGTTAFNYTGDATTLTFSFASTDVYLHSVKVYNVSELPVKDEATGYYIVPANDAAGFILALNSANAEATSENPAKIFLPNGLYDLGNTCLTSVSSYVSIIGESQAGVTIKNTPLAEGIGTTATLLLTGSDIYMQDLKLNCSDEQAGTPGASRCVTIQDKGTRNACKNVSLLSGQDTYYSNGAATQQAFFDNCFITGTVDFICGGGDVVFNNTTLYVNARSSANVIAAPSTNASTQWGYLMLNCTIDGDAGQANKYNFGRPWQGSPAATWINTTCNLLPSAAAYTSMTDGLTLRLHEYNTMDANGDAITGHSLAACKGAANSDALYLTAEEAANYTIANVLSGWDAEGLVAQATVTKNSVVNNVVNVPEGIYLVEKDGEFVEIFNGSSYTFDNSGEYTLRMANARGGFGEAVAILEPETIVVDETGVATYVTKQALDFSNVTDLEAYAVTEIKTSSVATEKVTTVPSGTPLLVKGVTASIPAIAGADAITNLLLASEGSVVSDGSTIFAYSKSKKKFAKVKEGVTIPEGKAYLVVDGNAPTTLDIDFESEATGVNGVAEAKAEVAPVKVIKNGQLFIGNYNVAGQLVK